MFAWQHPQVIHGRLSVRIADLPRWTLPGAWRVSREVSFSSDGRYLGVLRKLRAGSAVDAIPKSGGQDYRVIAINA